MKKNIYDLVIVGAGVCGLTSAIELAERTNSEMKILVLEAGERAGGRAKTITLRNGVMAELGAQWFHGGDNNSFYQWLRGRYLSSKLGEFALDTAKGRRIIWDGHRNPEKAFNYALDLLEMRYNRFQKTHPDEDISLETLAEKSGSRAVMDAAQFMSREWMATDGAHQISCKSYFEDPNGSGGWQPKGGMSRLIALMASEARGRGVQIRYNERVRGICRAVDGAQDYNIVALESGETVMARETLVTVSAGVLQNKTIGVDRRIDESVEYYTSGLIMANLAKIIMPLTRDFGDVANDARFYMVDDAYYIQGRPAGKPLVTLFSGGGTARRMEFMGDHQLTRIANRAFAKVPELRHLEGRLEVAEHTSWGRDKDYYGSYSNLLPGEKRYDPIQFQEAGLWLAGEAFSVQGSAGSLSGAHDSGIRAAEAILRNSSKGNKLAAPGLRSRPFYPS